MQGNKNLAKNNFLKKFKKEYKHLNCYLNLHCVIDFIFYLGEILWKKSHFS